MWAFTKFANPGLGSKWVRETGKGLYWFAHTPYFKMFLCSMPMNVGNLCVHDGHNL